MSRSSRKSDLSPSITKGSDSDVDTGRKSEVSNTSGGIGITQEVGKVNGVGVSLGVGVDVTPLDFGISANPAEGTISVAAGGGVPGGLLGVSGGVTIDTKTGQIVGGSIGGEVGGLGINISNSEKGGLGVEFTLQIPGTPIEFSLGLGFPKKEPSFGSKPPAPKGIGYRPDEIPPLNPKCQYFFHVVIKHWRQTERNMAELTIWNPRERWAEREVEKGEGSAYIIEPITNGNERSVLVGGISDPVKGPGLKGFIKRDIPNYQITESIGIGGFIGVPAQLAPFLASLDDGSFGWKYVVYPELLSCPTGEPPPPPLPKPISRDSPFPNPPPRRRKKMDACCQENLKFLRAIYTRLGLAKFPGKLPATIIQQTEKEGEPPPEPPSVPIPDLTTLLMWQFERDDERWGQWQVEIDIKDSDITEEGDQKKSIKFPNLAESVAEIEGQMLSVMTNVDALVALQIKNLAESGMARQEAIKGYLASKAIIKYMAFKSTEIDVPVPMTFTAGAETISDLLKESEGHIKGTDYVEKETLRDVYLDLLQAAAIIRAVHWLRIDTKNDTKSQLLNILKGSVDLAASIAKPQNPNGNGEEKTFNPEKDFEDFIDSVEDGFRNTTGISDVQNPYGKSPNRRPRIRQIGDNISQAGGKN